MQDGFLQPPIVLSQSQHKHRDSSSTQNSDYSDSSPTTTNSTSGIFDPVVTCLDSPIVLSPMKPFSSLELGLPAGMSMLSVNDGRSTAEPMRPKTSPTPRRARNMKNLSILPPLGSSPVSPLVSEPSSPSFIKPFIPGIKRKPSNLSLNTNTASLTGQQHRDTYVSPVSRPILQRRGLKHSASTPQMLHGLKSSTFAPANGMTFPTVLERNESGLSEILRPSKLGGILPIHDVSIPEEETQITTQVAGRGALDADEHLRDESEKHEDLKSPTYPDGPVAIYDDDVYLYLEPNAEEASRFDVVINVAREVDNPFAKSDDESSSPQPDTAMSTASFSTAFEFHLKTGESPTTPKNAKPPTRIPEYIHVPWDHNTDISVDLMSLCERIDQFVKLGKKVLVHCQQGASRSASLIIAYGLFRNPDLTVNDAYHAAQSKSRWISPNMKLMYCLQDFQKEVSLRHKPLHTARHQRTGRSPTKHRLTLSADVAGSSDPQQPLTAPLTNDTSFTAFGMTGMHFRGNSCPSTIHIDAGPSSAPSNIGSFQPQDSSVRDSPKFPRFPYDKPESSSTKHSFPLQVDGSLANELPETLENVSTHRNTVNFSRPMTWSRRPPSPRPLRESPDVKNVEQKAAFGSLPVNNTSLVSHTPDDFLDDTCVMSPRAEVMTSNPLRDVLRETIPPASSTAKTIITLIESSSTPYPEGVFSPTKVSFPGHIHEEFNLPEISDPRSPPTKGEAPIVRSIDELL
ncbi:tyrosine-protein phosphatase pmp1 [Ceratocystis lukuohia]|uniref:protein-tyrosine-phosphatase n=1 Tax=Ceratocystis lukuohia TaxID=2019550 RepID=A0ABR4MBA6_9PEZI